MTGTFGAERDASKDIANILIFLVILTQQKENQVISISGSGILPEVGVILVCQNNLCLCAILSIH